MACQVASAAALGYNMYEHAASSSVDPWSSICAVSCRQNQQDDDDHEEDRSTAADSEHDLCGTQSMRSTAADSEPHDLPEEAPKGRWADLADIHEEEPQSPPAKKQNVGKTRRWADLVDGDDEKEICRQGVEKLEISDKVQESQHSLPLSTHSSASGSEVASSPLVDPATPVDIQANATSQFGWAQWALPVAWQTSQKESKWKAEEQPHQHDQTWSSAAAARVYAKGAARNTGRGYPDSADRTTAKAAGKGAGKSAARNTGRGYTDSADRTTAKAAGKGAGKSGACARDFGAKGAGKSGGWNGNSSTKGHGKAASAKGHGKGATEKLQCQFIIGIEEDTKFRVVKRILGQGGHNMKHVAQTTDAKLRLRGRGSKFLEGLEQKESTDELMLCISAQDKLGFESAKNLVSELLEEIYGSYRLFCAKSGQRPPSLSIKLHQGYREGSR